jgi:hypothetical protein
MRYVNDGSMENALIELIGGVMQERGYQILFKTTNLKELMEIARKVLNIEDEETLLLLARLRS